MQPDLLNLLAGSIGPHAMDALKDGADGRVTAVFQSVTYLSIGSNLVSLTTTDIGPGPLNVTTNAPHGFWRKTGLQVGQSASLFNDMIYISGSAPIDLSAARPWSPPGPAHLTADRVRQALSHLDSLPLNPPAEGYGRTIRPHDDPDIKTAAGALGRLYRGDTGISSDLIHLLGRGPGLTPAGDDFLGGVMIGLYGIGQPKSAVKIWSHLAPYVTSHTGPISAALLRAAADGMGSAGLHKVMQALLSSENLQAALAELDQIGHSSGWDAFAGLVLAIRTHAACEHPAMA